MTSDAQTAYALAIAFDLFPMPSAGAAAGGGWPSWCARRTTASRPGFVGTPLVSDALTATGHLDTAYDLLLERECPSWLYQVEQGATTVWERWDSLLPDGTVNPGHHDLVQPLRAGRGRRLAAPGRRRASRPRRPATARPLRAPARRRADLGGGAAPDAIR